MPVTAKRYLSQPYWIDKRIEAKQEEIEMMRSRLTKSTAQLTGMPHGNDGSDWTDLDAAVLDMEIEIHNEILELCRIKREVFAVIDAVDEERYRTLLEYRYRNYYTFEQIAVKMGYSWRQVMRLHKEALKVVVV